MNLKRIRQILILGLLFGIVFCSIYFFVLQISGPAIFADEWLYFSLSRDIALKNQFLSEQYNPLYPFLISFFWKSKDVVTTYNIVIIFNTVIFSSIIIPSYLLAKKVLENEWMAYIFAFCTTMLPYKAITMVVWAEPLFYMLAMWVAYSFYLFVNNKSIRHMILLGVFCGLLYLTKQSGAIAIIAITLALLYEAIWNDKNKKNRLRCFIAIGLNFIPSIIWLIRNKIIGTSALGYTQEITSYKAVFMYPIYFFKITLYQLADVILSSYIIFPVLVILSVLALKKIDKKMRATYLLVFFWTGGIIVLSALHRMGINVDSDGAYLWSTYSRYTCVVIPFIILLGLYRLRYEQEKKVRWLVTVLLGIVLASLLCTLFTPVIASVRPYGFFNCFGQTYMNDIVYGRGSIVWDTLNIDWVQRVLPIVIVMPITIFIILLYSFNRKNTVMICLSMVTVFSIYIGLNTTYYTTRIMASQNEINKFFQNICENGIVSEELFVCENAREDTNNFIRMWFEYDKICTMDENKKYILSMDKLDYEVMDVYNDTVYLYWIK